VVKVQRPKVADLVERDIAAMSWLAPHLIGRIPVATLANPPALVELFAETIVEELDFRLEADNMMDIASVIAQTNQHAVVVPRPHPELVTRRVLVMERLDGFAWDDVDGMRRAGILSGRKGTADRVPGRGHSVRGLPRGSPWRQPVRPG
jgi:ubiquinone biosynthesis protein